MTVPMPEFLEPANPDDGEGDGALFDLDQPDTATPHL